MGTSDALVSIVTPAYNEEDYIEYAIKSVKNQTYDAIEHVVVDDGSTDETGKILAVYENDYDLRVVTQENQGRPGAMNRGLDEADGDIVMWLNADDVLFRTDTIATVVEAFENNPDADIIYGNRAVIDEENRLVQVNVNNPFFSEERLFRNLFAAFNYMRRDVVDERRFDPEYRLALDYEYFLRMASDDLTFKHVNAVLYCYRQHEDTTEKFADERQAEVDEIRARYSAQLDTKRGVERTVDVIATGVENAMLQLYTPAILLGAVDDDRIAFPISVDSVPEVVARSVLPPWLVPD